MKNVWDEKKDTKQNAPGCNSLQVCDDKRFEDEVKLIDEKEIIYLHQK